jgi:hypothetical protein
MSYINAPKLTNPAIGSTVYHCGRKAYIVRDAPVFSTVHNYMVLPVTHMEGHDCILPLNTCVADCYI